MARKGGELLDERADSRDGWLANNQFDRDGDHAAAHHFGDGGHGGRDGCHYLPAIVARVCGRWQRCASTAVAVACAVGSSLGGLW